MKTWQLNYDEILCGLIINILLQMTQPECTGSKYTYLDSKIKVKCFLEEKTKKTVFSEIPTLSVHF